MSLHVIPVNDAQPHEMSRWCWCIPAEQIRFPNPLEIMKESIITHNALDGRRGGEIRHVGSGTWEVVSV